MSWSELERFVASAERNPRLRRQLRRCRSSVDLIKLARLLGYRVSEADLRTARVKDAIEHRIEQRRRTTAS